MRELYRTEVEVSGGRNGRARSEDGLLDLPLAFPKSLGGAGDAPNPEQLFAAGFAACFNTSLRLSAKAMGLEAGDVTVTAQVRLVLQEDGAYGIEADLAARAPGLAPEDRDRVLAEARRVCAYSNALKGTAPVSVSLT